MDQFTPTQLRFPAIAGFTVRGDFNGGMLSSDFGALLLHGSDRQTGLIDLLASAIRDQRHASYIDHSLSDLRGAEIRTAVRDVWQGHLRHPLGPSNPVLAGPSGWRR